MDYEKKKEYLEEGVTITFHKNHKGVFVERKTPYEPPPTNVFEPIRVVINIGFFVIDEINKQKKSKKNLMPKVKLRIRYKQSDINEARRRKKPLKLAWWNGNQWVILPFKKTSSPSKNKWAGFGDAETSGWDDPPIAWGC